MTTTDYNTQVETWRHLAKKKHHYTDKDLAKAIGCSVSVIQHRSSDKTLYSLPFYMADRLRKLAEGGTRHDWYYRQ